MGGRGGPDPPPLFEVMGTQCLWTPPPLLGPLNHLSRRCNQYFLCVIFCEIINYLNANDVSFKNSSYTSTSEKNDGKYKSIPNYGVQKSLPFENVF